LMGTMSSARSFRAFITRAFLSLAPEIAKEALRKQLRDVERRYQMGELDRSSVLELANVFEWGANFLRNMVGDRPGKPDILEFARRKGKVEVREVEKEEKEEE